MLLPAFVLAAALPLQEGAAVPPPQEAGEARAPQEADEPDTPAAPARPGFETLFPQDSVLFVGIDDLAALLANLEASAWGRLFADPKAEPVRAAFQSLLTAMAKESQDELGLDLVEAVKLVSGRVGAGFSGAPGLGSGTAGEAESGDDFAGAIAADAGEHAGELRDRMLPLFQQLVDRGEAVMKVESAAEVDYVTLVPTSQDDVGRVNLAAAGGTLAIGLAGGKRVEGDDFARFVGSLATGAPAGDALAELPAFRQSLAARPGGIKAWLDLGRILRAEAAGKPEDDPEVAENRALGLLDFGPLSARFGLDAREMRLDAHQVWGGGWIPKVVDAWLVGGDSSLLKLVPAEVATAFSFHLDLMNGFDVTRAMIKETQGFDPFADEPAPEAGEGAAQQQPQLEPRKDFLEHLDGRLALFVTGTEPEEALPFLMGGPPMNFAAIVGVKNADALRTSIDTLVRSQGLHAARQRSEFEGFEVFLLPLFPLKVYYSIVGDFVVVSMSQTLLQDVLRRKSNPELPSLATDPGFARQIEGMTRSHAILMWGKSSSELLSGAAGGAEAGMNASNMTIDEEGNLVPGDPPAEDSVEARAVALLTALGQLDPALIAKHLPAGSLLGLAVDDSGLSFEAVSR